MKTALIIGASSGIGYATAAEFLKSDYNVINISRRECTLPGVRNMLCDVTNREDFDRVLTLVKEEHLDCFVYSAGFSMAAPFEYVLEGDYRYLFEVNLFAFMHALQTLLPTLRNTDGTVCAVSSLAAVLPIPFDEYYTASKAALNAFIEALSHEIEPVRVFSVMPGGTKTNFTEKRKIYPPTMSDGYAKRMETACARLADIEQNGVNPEKVAKTVFSVCTAPPMTPIRSSRFINKCAHMLSKILPSSMKKFLIQSVFFSEDE